MIGWIKFDDIEFDDNVKLVNLYVVFNVIIDDDGIECKIV